MNVLLFIVKDPPILCVLLTFIFSMIFCWSKYSYVKKKLMYFYDFIKDFKKTDLNFRFKEIDEWMCSNPYVSSNWLEFKNTLVFSESVALKNKNKDLIYKEVSSTVQNIQTTVDPLYFFNTESLVTSKMNYKFIQSIPTVLTGFGPLFTFMNIAVAFGKIDFSSQEATISSVAQLMSSMQVAALVSVFAVASSLIFMMFEKLLYARNCQGPLAKCQDKLSHLFDNISSEKFLLELLKETKIQNNSVSNLIGILPDNFKIALNASIASNLVPYLENLIFGINQLNKQIKETVKMNGKSDDVDDLF